MSRGILPNSSPWGASIPRRHKSIKTYSWSTVDFDSEVEVLLWRLTDTDMYPYGDAPMLKLSDLSGPRRSKGTPAADDEHLGKTHPAILLMLTATADDGGKPRKTSTLTVVAEDGLFKGGLRDRENEASLWRSAKTFEGLLGALEDALTSGEADWRAATASPRK